MLPPPLATLPPSALANTLLLYTGALLSATVICTVKVTTLSSPSARAASPLSRRRSLPPQPPAKPGLTASCRLPPMAGAAGGVTMRHATGSGKAARRLSSACTFDAVPLPTLRITTVYGTLKTLADNCATLPTPSAAPMAGFATSVTAVQSDACAQRGRSGPVGTMVLLRVPLAATFALTVTAATAFGARPAGTVHTSLLAARGAQTVGAAGVTAISVRLAASSSVRTMAAVVAPLPLLVALMVQLTVSPMLAAALSATFLTITLGLVTLVLVWQSAGARHSGASGPDGTTLLRALPAWVTVADTSTVASPPLPIRPAGTLQVSTLPATGLHVARTGVTTTFARPAGKVSARVMAARVGPLPELVTVMVHTTVSPTLAAARLAIFFTATFGPVRTTPDSQLLACAQAGLSGPPGMTRFASRPSTVPVAVTRTLRVPVPAAN